MAKSRSKMRKFRVTDIRQGETRLGVIRKNPARLDELDLSKYRAKCQTIRLARSAKSVIVYGINHASI